MKAYSHSFLAISILVIPILFFAVPGSQVARAGKQGVAFGQLPPSALVFSISPLLNPLAMNDSVVYVDISNNSGVEDGTAAHPYNRIQEGIEAASNGYTVQVAVGTYPEKIVLKDGVHLLGAGAGATIIDGAGQGDSVITAQDIVTETIIEGFTIMHGSGKRINIYTYGGAVYGKNSILVFRNCTFLDNSATDGPGGIQVENSTTTIDKCAFNNHHGWWGGTLSIYGGSALIKNSTINESYSGYGGTIWIDQNAQLTSINNIVSQSHNTSAIGIGTATATIINNTIANNYSHGIETGTYYTGGETGSATITNTILWDNGNDDLVNLTATYSDIKDGDAGEGNISVPPLFVNPANNDYHLKRSSGCIDAGTSTDAPSTDFEGDHRPIDGNGDGIAAVDIGADEYPFTSFCFLPLLSKCVTLYSDNFSNPASGWEVDTQPSYALGYLDNEYRIAVNSGWAAWSTKNFGVSDYQVEVDTRAVGQLDGGAGLFFGGENNGFYVFEVNEGWYSLWRFAYATHTWTELVGWTASPAVHSGTQTNHLKVVRTGASIALYANGVELNTVSDSTYPGTWLGMLAEAYSANYESRFDNFVVMPAACSSISAASMPERSATFISNGGAGSATKPRRP